MSKLKAGIIVIGDEILSGRTHDINSHFIAKKLIESGIELIEIIVIKDNKETIIRKVLEFHKNFNYVFTTGGIGPTHDDITSECISSAFNIEYCYHPDAYKILEDYYPKGEFNDGRKKMAMMPKNSELILNPLTAAPGYKINNIYVLPGVPDIMKEMFISLLEKLEKNSPKKIVTINTNLFESIIASDLEKIQNNNLNCSIGSYPYFNDGNNSGGVNIVVSSWTLENVDNIAQQITEMVSLLGGKSSIV